MSIEVEKLVKELSNVTKSKLIYGKGFWNIRGIEEKNIKSIRITDGPHGVRSEIDKTAAVLNKSYPSTCFPPACLTACSFDEDLLFQMGKSIGEECRDQNVAVLLGPGTNIKRSPVCGRNFEYFSEDPLLAGKMASGFINGVQSQGVGTSLKHFACNNQEFQRLLVNVGVDDKALNEIYLKPFEIAVKESRPWTIMCSYNQINDVYSSDNKYLLNDILRKKWGFQGLVMSDWGALNDNAIAHSSGLDLEMPEAGNRSKQTLKELKKGTLKQEDLDACVKNILNLHDKHLEGIKRPFSNNYDEHFEIARKVARESMVLLKNNGVLPYKENIKTLVVGDFAKTPRYQGAGSSIVNTYKKDSFVESLEKEHIPFTYAQGYLRNDVEPNNELIEEATALAKVAEQVVVFIGLPEIYESEGYDREKLSMPASHIALVDELLKVNPNVSIVLQCGAPIELPFKEKANAILLSYLGGEASGCATLDLIFGRFSPSGKLAETWPIDLASNPSYPYFPGENGTVLYKESIFIGYRYYLSENVDVNYPFGFGLSYAKFAYSNFKIKKEKDKYIVGVTSKNISPIAAKDTVMLFVGKKDSKTLRPLKELKSFRTCLIGSYQEENFELSIEEKDLKVYDVKKKDLFLEDGEYQLYLSTSSVDVIHEFGIIVHSNDVLTDLSATLPSYYLKKDLRKITDKEFEALLTHDLPLERKTTAPFTINNTIIDIKDTFIGKLLVKKIYKVANQTKDELTKSMFLKSAFEIPLRGASMGGMLTLERCIAVVNLANKHYIRGIYGMIFNR